MGSNRPWEEGLGFEHRIDEALEHIVLCLPLYSNPIGCKNTVVCDDRDVFRKTLGNDQSIKWIFMMKRQTRIDVQMRPLDRQYFNLVRLDVISEQFFEGHIQI